MTALRTILLASVALSMSTAAFAQDVTVLRIGLDEAACKVRTGGPNDDATDLQVAAWAGTLPMRVQRLPAIVHEDCDAAEPDYVSNWSRE